MREKTWQPIETAPKDATDEECRINSPSLLTTNKGDL